MVIRPASTDDASAIQSIYAPIVQDSVISFEFQPPGVDEMRERIVQTLQQLPWLVSLDGKGAVSGYVYAGKHSERAAYQWSVNVSAYVRADCRRTGLGQRLYAALFDELTALGYFQAFAGITLPNVASVALHESMGFVPLGVYRKVGYKHGAWHDVGWWQKALRAPAQPAPPRAYRAAAPT
jgi:phosphinothricin acetyltransferase